MTCDEFRSLLDAYIDGELSPARMQALEDHAKACEACMEEFQAAQLLKDTLAHIDDEIAVPLQAQAAWRNAVRAEAKKKSARKWLRVSYAAAAALVLALGVGLFAKDAPIPQNEPQLAMRTLNQAETAVVMADGSSGAAGADVHVHRKMRVSSLQDALRNLEQLTLEYSGSFSAQGEDACIITLPADYMEDFTSASACVGEQIFSETIGEAGDTICVLIQLSL